MSQYQSRQIKKIILVLVLIYAIPALTLGMYKLLRPKSLQSGQIIYSLAWDTSGVQRDKTAWVFKTNLMYTVKLEQGFLNAYGVQLMSCLHTHSWLERLLAGVEAASGVALAGHSPGQDLAALQANTVENLLQLQRSSFNAVTVHEPNYCKGYFVATKATPNSKNLNSNISGKSIFLRGTFSKNGIKSPFIISSENAFGDVHNLLSSSSKVHVGISAEPIRVEFIRQLKNLFDNLEFETDSDFNKGMTVLRNLNEHVSVNILSGKIHNL